MSTMLLTWHGKFYHVFFMKKISIFCLLLTLISCGHSFVGGVNQTNISSAGVDSNTTELPTAVEQFFLSWTEESDATAIDTNLENSLPATQDQTFTDGHSYSVVVNEGGLVEISTNSENLIFQWDHSEDNDFFQSEVSESFTFKNEGVKCVLEHAFDDPSTQENEETFTVRYFDSVNFEFYWELVL